ncbi:MAG TPA: hypothetical protein VH396_08095 [Chitinophagaceae bacterium]|jgi:hypothetical protein
MRRLLIFFPLFFYVSTKAQAPLTNASEISSVLSKVIHDYPNYFSNIKGEIVEESPQVVNYESLLNMKDMPRGVIVQYGDEKEHVYSWRNILLETENFEEAKKKFRLYYTQIKKTTAIINQMDIRLVADYSEPDENKQFSTIIFKLVSIEPAVKDVVADLSLQYEMSEWKITLSLYHIEEETRN